MVASEVNQAAGSEENPYQSPHSVDQESKLPSSSAEFENNRRGFRRAIRDALLFQASFLLLAGMHDGLSLWIQKWSLIFLPFVLLSIALSWIPGILFMIYCRLSARHYSKSDLLGLRYGFLLIMLLILILSSLAH